MFGDERLNKKVFGGDTCGKEVENKFPGRFPQHFGVVGHRHGVVIHYSIITTISSLKVRPVFYCPEVITKVHITCRLYAGEYSFSVVHDVAFDRVRVGIDIQGGLFLQTGREISGLKN